MEAAILATGIATAAAAVYAGMKRFSKFAQEQREQDRLTERLDSIAVRQMVERS